MARGRVSAAVRAFGHRRAHTVVSVIVIALLAAVAAAAPWYERMVRDEATAQVLAVGDDAGAWRIDSRDRPVPEEYRDLHPLVVDPVGSTTAEIAWSGGDPAKIGQKVGEGVLMTREDVCAHLELVVGRCPAAPGEVAVSTADRDNWGLEPGAALELASVPADADAALQVTGVYRVVDADDPYWYGVLPTGRSGWLDEEYPLSDQFVTVPGDPRAFTGLAPQRHLDLRVDGERVTASDLDEVRAAYDDVAAAADGDDALRVVGSLPETLDSLDDTFATARSTIGLTVAQLAVLFVVALVLVAGLNVGSRRRDIGLQRLRGRSSRAVARSEAAQWLVLAVPSAAAGLVLAGAALRFLGGVMPDGTWWPPPWSAVLLGAAVPVVSTVLVAVATRRTAESEIPTLLRSTQPRLRGSRPATFALDLVLVTGAACALLVASTSAESSPLVVLVPVLLALAVGVLACRALSALAARWGRRSLVTRPGAALAGLEIARGDGLRTLVVLPAVAAALVVLATQALLIGDLNRDHRAAVETGAGAVHRTTADPVRTLRAVDAVDPSREQATVVTHVGDESDSFRMMYVEPAAFARIAHGADAATPAEWSAVTVPDGGEVVVTADRLRVGVAGEVRASEPPLLTMTYAGADGIARVAALGDLGPGAFDRSWTTPVPCTDGCRLLGWSVLPTGDTTVAGTLALEAHTRDGWAPVPLGEVGWQPVTPDFPSYDVALDAAADPALEVALESGGLPVRLLSPDLVTTVPVLAPEVGADRIADGAEATTPGQDRLPTTLRGTLDDAAPQQLRDVVLADLTAVTRYGERRVGQNVDVEVWLAEGADPDLVERLAEQGLSLQLVADADDVRTDYARSAEALAAWVNPVAAVVAALLALGAVLLTVAGSWRQRCADLAALDLVGVGRRTWRRATHLSLVVPCVLGVLVGAGAGIVGTAIAVRRVPIFAEPEPTIALRLDLLPVPLVVAVLATAGLVVLGSVAASRVLVRRAVAPREVRR